MKYISIKPLTNLYKSTECLEITDQIYISDSFEIIEESKNTVLIKTNYNYFGYISKQYIVKIDTSSILKTRETIINIAKKFLDTPYLWGGKSIYGIDCSGLTFMCYYLCNITIFRDSDYKKNYAKIISKKELLPADLIYSKGHIMLYIGEDLYIHASKSKNKVLINSLDKNSILYRKDIIIDKYASVFKS